MMTQSEIDVIRRVAKFLNTAHEDLARELEAVLEEDDAGRNAAIVEELYSALMEEV